MTFPEDQIAALKRYCSGLSLLTEASITYLQMDALKLPDGCEPQTCDALVCPSSRDGYPSRLFLSERIASRYQRNWNANNVRIGERNWHAFSWNVGEDLPLLDMLLAHLSAFTKEK